MTDLMSQLALDAAIESFLDELDPVEAALQRQILTTVVNRAGGFNREAILAYLPLQVHEWAPAQTAGRYVPQPSTVVRLAAYASTPPSSGNATVSLTIIRPNAGVVPAGTLVLLQGESMAETALTTDAPAGSWLFASVTTANGASGVSIAAVRRLL